MWRRFTELWFSKKEGENTVMPVLSASQAFYPVLRSLFPPNIRLSML